METSKESPTIRQENVEVFQVHTLQPGEAVHVEGCQIDGRGRPKENVPLALTVMMTNHIELGNGHPFAGLDKLYGVAIASSDNRLLASFPPGMNVWVGDTVTVGEKWNAGTFRAGRAIHVRRITVIHS